MAITNNVFSRISADFRHQWGIHFRFIFRVVVMFLIPLLCVVITVSLSNRRVTPRQRDKTRHIGPQTKGIDKMGVEGDQIVIRPEEKRGDGNSSQVQQRVEEGGHNYQADGFEEKGLPMSLQGNVQGKTDGQRLSEKLSQEDTRNVEESERKNNDSKYQNITGSNDDNKEEEDAGKEDGELVAAFTLRPNAGVKPNHVIAIATGVMFFIVMVVTILLGSHLTMKYRKTLHVQVEVFQNRYNVNPRAFGAAYETDDSDFDSDLNEGSEYDSGLDSIDRPTPQEAVEHPVNIQPQVAKKRPKNRRSRKWNKKKAPAFDPNYKKPNNTPDTSYLYGKSIYGRNHILLYNRVPKCGSRTLLSLTETLAERYSYHKPGEIVISRYKGQKKEEIPYANIVRRRLKKTAVASVLHGHIHFIDFSRDQQLLPHKRPIYINLIRDPFDRLVSQYYFVRFGDGKFTNLKQLHKMTHPKHINETFNDCVQLDRPECVGPYMQSLMVKYFCGYSPVCQEPTEEALEKAKQNLDKYVVVGVAEDYEDFLKVLEKLLPDFFRGVVDEFKTSTERKREKKMKAKKKDPTTPEVREKVKALLEMDYRFYNHTRARFQALKQSLGIE